MYSLRCGERELVLDTPKVMGILNVTPDSFSDGSKFNTLDSALRQAYSMVNQGAHIIDIGGESTRPGAEVVSEQQEMDRVLPVIDTLRKELDVILSVDTSTPNVMREASKLGVGLINDVRALEKEGALSAAADTNLPVCLMHMKGTPSSMQSNPQYQNVTQDIYKYLGQRISVCENSGISRQKLLADPGFGFGKSIEHNYTLLNQLQDFQSLGVPLLVGMSRKSMIGLLLKKPVEDRLIGSVVAATIAAMKGAHILRVHDVAATVDAVKIVNALTGIGIEHG